MTCVDTPDWNNFSGRSCADYGATWCFGGAARPGHEWTMGATFNFPEQHCCACGKPYTTAAARAALPLPIAPPIDAPFEDARIGDDLLEEIAGRQLADVDA